MAAAPTATQNGVSREQPSFDAKSHTSQWFAMQTPAGAPQSSLVRHSMHSGASFSQTQIDAGAIQAAASASEQTRGPASTGSTDDEHAPESQSQISTQVSASVDEE
jgi:hypothetical protein